MDTLDLIEEMVKDSDVPISSDDILKKLGKRRRDDEYLKVIEAMVGYAKKYRLQVLVVFAKPLKFDDRKKYGGTRKYSKVLEITGVPIKELYSYYNDEAGDTYLQFEMRVADNRTVEVPVSQTPRNYIRRLVILENPWEMLDIKPPRTNGYLVV